MKTLFTPTVALFALLLAGTCAGAEATLTPLSGNAVRGAVQELTAETITLLVDGQPQSWPSNTVRRLDFVVAEPTPPAGAILIELLDGSQIQATQCTLADSVATLILLDGRRQEARAAAIRYLRLQDLGKNEALLQQWRELVSQPVSKDTLVFRRETDGAVRLDTLDGVLYGVSETKVDFEYDGDRVSPNRERVAGLMLFHPPSTSQMPAAACRILDTNGSVWNAREVRVDQDRLVWSLPTGLSWDAPLSEIRSLDYAAGNLSFLSDLAPEVQTWRPFVESRLAPALLEARFAPRFDQAFDGGPLRLAGTAYTKGVALRSYTQLTFRLVGDYRRFRAIIGIDDRVRQAAIPASVRLSIAGDSKTLYDGTIDAQQPPLDLDLDITQVKRLRITVDFGDNLDIADYLVLCDARLTK